MSHAEPKITIDLKEYNELLKHNKELDERLEKSEIALYQKALYWTLAYPVDPAKAGAQMNKDGVELVRLANLTGDDAWKDVIVKRITK